MTKEEFTKHIVPHLSEEIEDACNYYDMAMNADKMDNDYLTRGLIEMTKDEYSHAKFIMGIMDEMDIEIPPEEAKRWYELDKKMEKLFL